MRKHSIQAGDSFDTNNCGKVSVVEYHTSLSILVRFTDGTLILTKGNQLRNGQVKNPNHKSVHGVGFIGIGEFHKTSHPRIYGSWKAMLGRCYDQKSWIRFPAFRDYTVKETWHNFQNFAADYIAMIGYGNEGWQLDKAVLQKNCLVYCKENCVLVPAHIANLLLRGSAARGDTPIGVSNCKRINTPYISYCNVNGQTKQLGYYKTVDDAFSVYKEFKEAEIKRVAVQYENVLDPKAFTALMSYTVQYND